MNRVRIHERLTRWRAKHARRSTVSTCAFPALRQSRLMSASQTAQIARKRLFVPLRRAPYVAFAGGAKTWEVRLLRRQWNERNVRVGLQVELRLGYAVGRSLWGQVDDVRIANSLFELFDLIDYQAVVPSAPSRNDAVETAARTLGAADQRVIAFRVGVYREVVARRKMNPSALRPLKR